MHFDPLSRPLPDDAVVPRTIRSFARKEDADRAVAVLADEDIPAKVHEYFISDPKTGIRSPRGCSLSVSPDHVRAASQIMLRMAPSEAPPRDARAKDNASRLRRRPLGLPSQKGAGFMIGIAILCSAGAILFATSELFKPKKRRPLAFDPLAPTLLYEEDLNHDNVIDNIREYTMEGVPIAISEDRNYDGIFETRWIWQFGKLAYRDLDLDQNGTTDERTFHDPEGAPFYTNLQPNGSGFPIERRIYRDKQVWRILTNSDNGMHFDHVREFNKDGSIMRDEDLSTDAPENAAPIYPLPDLVVDQPAANVPIRQSPLK